jgi:hypothetical protein
LFHVDRQAGRQADITNLSFGYELFGAVCLSLSSILRPVQKKTIFPLFNSADASNNYSLGKARNSHKMQLDDHECHGQYWCDSNIHARTTSVIINESTPT